MSFLDKVKKATPQAPVITIIGFPGVGKSTLAALFEKPIFVQAENATSVFETWPEDKQPAFFPELPQPRQAKDGRQAIKTSEVLLAQLRELATADHDFKTLVMDAITTLDILLAAEVVALDPNGAENIGEAAGGYGKGFLQAAALHGQIRSACEHLRKRGMTIIFLAHSGISKVKNRPDVEAYSTWSLDMNENSRKIYVATSDAVLYLKSQEIVMGSEKDKKNNIKTYGKVTSTGERLLITSSDGTIGYVDAKNRYGMPQEIFVPHMENPILPYIPFYGVPIPSPETTKTTGLPQE